jgi:hypothetical protein
MHRRDGASRKSEDGYPYPVRRVGRCPAHLTTHLRLRYVLELAIGGLIVAAAL